MSTPEYQPSKYQQILETQTLVIMAFDTKCKLDFINSSGEMLMGTGAHRLLGNTLDHFFIEQPEFLESAHKALEEGYGFTERDVEITDASGRHFQVDCIATPIIEGGYTEGLLLELIPVDRQLRIFRDESLVEQSDVTRTIVRGMAHEIKNPLGGLRGAAQLLERELPDPALKEYTNVIIGEADRLQNLVDRLLGPNTLPKIRSINIHEALERVRSLVAAEVSERVTIKTDYDPSIPTVSGDLNQLIQLLLNIVRNAVQALEHQEKGEIILRTRPQRQFTIGQKRHKVVLRIDIIDNGPGIPPEMVERIFYPMVTSRAEGTGLGLSIAQALVQQHDGTIECESEPGRTRFSIYLPFEHQETDQ